MKVEVDQGLIDGLVRLCRTLMEPAVTPPAGVQDDMRGYLIGLEEGRRVAGVRLLAHLLMYEVMDFEPDPDSGDIEFLPAKS